MEVVQGHCALQPPLDGNEWGAYCHSTEGCMGSLSPYLKPAVLTQILVSGRATISVHKPKNKIQRWRILSDLQTAAR